MFVIVVFGNMLLFVGVIWIRIFVEVVVLYEGWFAVGREGENVM